MPSRPKTSPDKELIRTLEAGGAAEYLEYLQSGKRILWVNFKAGIAKGLGVTIGMTLVLGAFIWILTQLVDLPVVGEYFEDAKEYAIDYTENTDYSDEFVEMNRLLQEINENTKNQ
ncbi:MAG TPA: hypothetical protein ENH48_03810 [Halieaceae bacterium]|nr:hypothetical protein [Halieaceae bacterium]